MLQIFAIMLFFYSRYLLLLYAYQYCYYAQTIHIAKHSFVRKSMHVALANSLLRLY